MELGRIGRQQLQNVSGCQMAAVDEHQFRYHTHRLDFRGAQKGIGFVSSRRREHDTTQPFLRRGLTVTSNVDDPPRMLMERGQHRKGIRTWEVLVVGTDEARDMARVESAGTAQSSGHRVGLAARAGQPEILVRVALRLADDEHAILCAGVGDIPTEVVRAQFCTSFARIAQGSASRRTPVFVSSSSQGMPAVPPSTSITISVEPPRNGSISAGTRMLNSVRPIDSPARVFDAATSSVTRGACVDCAVTSVRARLVSRLYAIDWRPAAPGNATAVMKS